MSFECAGPGSAGSTPMSHEATAAAAANAAAAAAAAVLQRGNAQPSAETMEQVSACHAACLSTAMVCVFGQLVLSAIQEFTALDWLCSMLLTWQVSFLSKGPP